jgi:prolyl-tRNA synthetase
MKWSQFCIPDTSRSNYGDFSQISHQELIRTAGIYRKECSGVFGYSHLGALLRRKIHNHLSSSFEDFGCQEVNFGLLEKVLDWEITGRFERYHNYMILIEGGRMCLAPTHDEMALRYIGDICPTYDSLPLSFFQIGRKFRNHTPRNNPKMAIEFEMADCYMFNEYNDPGIESVELGLRIIENFFSKLGLRIYHTKKGNHTPIYVEDKREGVLLHNLRTSNCDKACSLMGLEVAKIQIEGTEWSERLNIRYHDSNNIARPFNLVCMGVGIGWVLEAVVSKYRDEKGLNWPEILRPFDLGIIPVNISSEEMIIAEILSKRYEAFGRKSVIHDKRLPLGRRLKDVDLIGCSKKIVIGTIELKNKKAILEFRNGLKEEISL